MKVGNCLLEFNKSVFIKNNYTVSDISRGFIDGQAVLPGKFLSNVVKRIFPIDLFPDGLGRRVHHKIRIFVQID